MMKLGHEITHLFQSLVVQLEEPEMEPLMKLSHEITHLFQSRSLA